jgi:hypothetical protein
MSGVAQMGSVASTEANVMESTAARALLASKEIAER